MLSLKCLLTALGTNTCASVLGSLFAARCAPDAGHSECGAVEQAQQEEGEEGDGGGPQAVSGGLLQAVLIQHHPGDGFPVTCKTQKAC